MFPSYNRMIECYTMWKGKKLFKRPCLKEDTNEKENRRIKE